MTGAKVATAFARVFGIGHLPKSPGTFGSLPGLLVGYALHVLIGAPWGIALALVALTTLSFWCIHVYEKALGLHDDQRVVLDEVCGQAIAIAFVTPTVLNYVVGFALFRLLDITKPPPIGTVDRDVPGAAGTLFDDVLAGAAAAAILFGISGFLADLQIPGL